MIVVKLESIVLPMTVFLLVGTIDEHDAWAKKRHKHERDPDKPVGAARAYTCWHSGNGWEGVIWMPYFRRGDAFDAGKLAHEALHIAWRLLDRLGCYDEEAHCYVVQWIVNIGTLRILRKQDRSGKVLQVEKTGDTFVN